MKTNSTLKHVFIIVRKYYFITLTIENISILRFFIPSIAPQKYGFACHNLARISLHIPGTLEVAPPTHTHTNTPTSHIINILYEIRWHGPFGRELLARMSPMLMTRPRRRIVCHVIKPIAKRGAIINHSVVAVFSDIQHIHIL